MLSFLRMMAGKNLSVMYVPLVVNIVVLGVQTASCFVVFFLLKAYLEGALSAGYAAWLSALLAGLFVLYYVLVNYYAKRSMSGGYRVVADLRTRVCDHLRRLSLAFFRRNNPSDVSGALLRNMSDAEAVFGIYLYEAAACFTVPLLLGLVMFVMDWRMTMAMLCVIAAAFPIAVASSRSAFKESPLYIAALAKVDAATLEYFTGIAELKGAGRTGAAFTPFTRSNDAYLDIALKMEAKYGLLGHLFLVVLDMAFVAALITGCALLAGGGMTLAVFLFFLIMAYRVLEPLMNFGSFLTEFKFMVVSMKKIAAILYEEALPVRGGGAAPKGNSVEFADVSFAYQDKDVLSGVSFTMPEGSVTALVGESGGGKTTVSNLLLRFWDVNAGSVRIGGADVRGMSQEDLYTHFSVVFQDVYLFNDTVTNNIRLARPGASDEQVLEAARLACCDDFVRELEKGYDTRVGERGSRLSGGERQRIAIARAILKDAPILILDEATASVDPENELQIQQGLTNLTRGKTLLVIAHRLTTIREADQILVLQGGRIVERGGHDELMSQAGVYKGLWDSQERLKSWRIRQEGISAA